MQEHKDDDEMYFDSIAEKMDDIRAERDKFNEYISALKELEELVAAVDCDIGIANMQMFGDGNVKIETSSYEIRDELKDLMHHEVTTVTDMYMSDQDGDRWGNIHVEIKTGPSEFGIGPLTL